MVNPKTIEEQFTSIYHYFDRMLLFYPFCGFCNELYHPIPIWVTAPLLVSVPKIQWNDWFTVDFPKKQNNPLVKIRVAKMSTFVH